MNANELRIGNWIADRGGKEWKIDYWESKNKVSAKEPIFNTQGFEFNAHPFTEYVDYLQPILLTKEWLFTFEKTKHNALWANLSQDTDGYFLWVSGFKVYVKYVHKLQNLYFALTNEELTAINE